MARIPIGITYTATVTRAIWKPVLCEYCGCQFVYHLQRTASGSATSYLWLNNQGASDKANDKAEDLIERKLAKEFNIISCPDCGCFQRHMIKELRSSAWTWAFFVSVFFCLAGVISDSIGYSLLVNQDWWTQLIFSVSLTGLCCLPIIIMIVRAIFLNPNSSAKKRKGRLYSEDYKVIRLTEIQDIKKLYFGD